MTGKKLNQTTKNTIMKANQNPNEKRYIFSYYGSPIPKANFLKSVPENWESKVENGEFSWGGYRASEIETEEI